MARPPVTLRTELTHLSLSDLPAFLLSVFDVDGTLKPRDGPMTARVRDAFDTAQNMGAVLTIATGRVFRSAVPYAEELRITLPIICTGGALVREPLTGEVLHRESIPAAAALRVIESARAANLPVAAYFDDDLYVERVIANSPFAGYVERTHGVITDDLASALPGEPIHMAVVTDGDQTRILVRELQSTIGDLVNVTSGHPLLAEIDSLGASKGSALRWLSGYLGVTPANILAVGDDWNDIAMLEYAGTAVAMGDAPPEVLAVAYAVAPTAADDGAAWVIENLLLPSVARHADARRG